MKAVIGIDPGMTGAIAAVSADRSTLYAVHDMPTLKTGSSSRINAVLVCDILREIHCEFGIAYVAIEQVNAMPGGGQRRMGASSAFNFGRGFGCLEGVIAAMLYRIHYVRPTEWKAAARLSGKDKDCARPRALELYPGAELHRKRDIGRADAILIAHYGNGGRPDADQ